MGKGTVLSLVEKSKMEAYFESGLSCHKIAEKTGRHRETIDNFLKNKESYGKYIIQSGEPDSSIPWGSRERHTNFLLH